MEWLEDEPPSPELRRRQRQVIGGIGAAGAVLLLVLTVVVPRLPGAPPPPPPASSTTRSSRPPATVPPGRTTTPGVTTWTTEGFLPELDETVFVRNADTVYRIETRTGQVTATPTGRLGEGSPLSFVAASDRVLIVSWEPNGVAVPDGRPARPLTGLLTRTTTLLPGPGGRVWVSTDPNSQSTMQLADGSGRPVGQAVRSGSDYALVPDGRGGLLLVDVGGSYLATERGLERISRGAVTAVGRNHLLAVDCDARHRCSRYLLDRRSGAQRRIGGLRMEQGAPGVVSADGRFAALLTWRLDGGQQLDVLDLARNRVRTTLTSSGSVQQDDRSTFWLPDGRLLGLLDGRIFVLDPDTDREARYFNLRIPEPLLQLTVRDGF